MSRLELVSTIQQLTDVKEKLANDVLDPMLNWPERDELNQAIHWINTRINSLKQTLQKRPSV
ncbi:hypothetical protein [Ammoniphilus sp. 3BR4]|uniref:hypothetical protein n=1 Tax=Ammoniphilus sp. 3BR4 TaxID=3158265 RepID=UPI003466EA39